MNMEQHIPKDLENFIFHERWEYKFELKSHHSLHKDLKIYGDDAVEFISAFSKRFNVDVSNFNFDKYFPSEGISFFRFIREKDSSMKNDLTIGDLVTAIRDKVLE